jgi:hypothetical protein
MDNTVMLAIYFPLVIVGMVLVIMWGMSAAESPRKGYDQGESERMHSREV